MAGATIYTNRTGNVGGGDNVDMLVDYVKIEREGG